MAVELSRQIPSQQDALINLMGEVREFCEKHEIPDDAAYAAVLAVEELINNVIHYGCKDGHEATIRMCLSVDDGEMSLQLEDDATLFDPLTEAPEPEGVHGGTHSKAGGLGIYLVRSLMDHAHYEVKNGGNRLLLRKSLARKKT